MERETIQKLFKQLDRAPKHPFPAPGKSLPAPRTHGVYVIRDAEGVVVHVGRTYRGKNGLYQRLENHLAGSSTFTRDYLKGHGKRLRSGFTFQYYEVSEDRQRALLEHCATAWHCPKHLGVGAARVKPKKRK
jgi:hypothetical protein